MILALNHSCSKSTGVGEEPAARGSRLWPLRARVGVMSPALARLPRSKGKPRQLGWNHESLETLSTIARSVVELTDVSDKCERATVVFLVVGSGPQFSVASASPMPGETDRQINLSGTFNLIERLRNAGFLLILVNRFFRTFEEQPTNLAFGARVAAKHVTRRRSLPGGGRSIYLSFPRRAAKPSPRSMSQSRESALP